MRARRWAALALVAGLALLGALAGCNSSPCAGHGGVKYWSGSWYYCNDGTVEPG